MTEELISLDKICCIWYWLIYYVSNSRDGRGFDYINRYDPKANAGWKKDNERKRTMLISSGVQFQRQSAACKHVGYWLWWHERLFVWGRCFPSQEQYRVCKQNPQMRLSELLALIMHQRLNHLAGKISKKIIRAVLTLHGSVLETRVFPLLFADVWIIQIEFSLIRNIQAKCKWQKNYSKLLMTCRSVELCSSTWAFSLAPRRSEADGFLNGTEGQLTDESAHLLFKSHLLRDFISLINFLTNTKVKIPWRTKRKQKGANV